jgi:isoleucyl-tRNA synthetase
MFHPVRGKPDFPAMEAAISRLWREARTYEKSLEARRGAERFVFFEGPPTANGMPHPGHCLTRTIKDLYPRYRTMRGQLCERKAGWDTHGLPVEVEVCKQLGIHSKAQIEAYGIEPFIHRCQESVWRYMKEWETLTDRIGFWIDLSSAYVTYHQSYVESVWWALADLFDRGLLYQGHKIVWWWAQGGTALSSGEVGQGYREVQDPSVYAAFPLLDEAGQPTQRSLVAWTTTPWTLPSNQFAAVKAELEYVVLREEGSDAEYIVAEALSGALAEKTKKTFATVDRMKGSALVGRAYLPPFDTFRPAGPPHKAPLASGGADFTAWRVVAADFVTTDTGTGIVHIAPAFGEVDYGVLMLEQPRFAEGSRPQLLNCVAPDGTFTDLVPMGSGRFVKDCDRDILRDLRARGVLVHHEQYVHDYPFCWRADNDPLIQYPRASWFIRTSEFRDQMLANNAQINWLPEHIKDGRFGNFLATNVDWALSRERYWGTPLPIWVCEETGKGEAVPSYAALVAKPGAAGMDIFDRALAEKPDLSPDLRVHKPYIDAVTYDSPFAAGARMRRVSEVIDCWFDSGAMPFAQWGWPHTQGDFANQFPADFISEAIDQTRGWFYSQLAISTLLFGDGRQPAGGGQPALAANSPHPFRTCIVLGHMLGEDGAKMSKSKRNYREPAEIFDKYGADALRWFFLAGQPPWTSIRYSERAIRESVPEFLLRLWNVYSFFVIYARIDGFDPAALLDAPGSLEAADLAAARGWQPVEERGELDRWMLSELKRTSAAMVERMDRYDHFGAAGELHTLVDGVSNWFVRRSRDRFWAAGRADTGPQGNAEKLAAYWTLYETLLGIVRLAAPFVPFVAEEIWQNLAVTPFGTHVPESVHLCDYPTGAAADGTAVDADLVRRMALVRDVASLGRSARAAEKLKVRQPLSKVEVILAGVSVEDAMWLEAHAELVCDELNVKQFEICREPDRYIERSVQPDLKKLGPRLGKDLPKVRNALQQADAAALLADLAREGSVSLPLAGGGVAVLQPDDLIVRTTAKPGWVAAENARAVVVVASELTPELIAEGMVREVVHAVQSQRRALDLEFTDRIELVFETSSPQLLHALETHLAYVAAETLADPARIGVPAGDASARGAVETLDIDGHPLTIHVRPLTSRGGGVS